MTSSDAFFKSWKETVPSTSATDTRKKHDTLKRHFVVAFTSIAAAVLLLILTSRRNTECNEFFREDEHFASDPRLDKYQSPSDASFCHDLTGNLDQEALFSLSPESSFTFFLSRASSIIGSFHIRESTDSSDDTIRVNITGAEDVSKTPYSYARRNLESEMVTACYAERDGEQGIILWAHPTGAKLPQNLFLRIAVTLPVGRSLRDLSTDFTNSIFDHVISSTAFDGFVRLGVFPRRFFFYVHCLMCICNGKNGYIFELRNVPSFDSPAQPHFTKKSCDVMDCLSLDAINLFPVARVVHEVLTCIQGRLILTLKGGSASSVK